MEEFAHSEVVEEINNHRLTNLTRFLLARSCQIGIRVGRLRATFNSLLRLFQGSLRNRPRSAIFLQNIRRKSLTSLRSIQALQRVRKGTGSPLAPSAALLRKNYGAIRQRLKFRTDGSLDTTSSSCSWWFRPTFCAWGLNFDDFPWCAAFSANNQRCMRTYPVWCELGRRASGDKKHSPNKPVTEVRRQRTVNVVAYVLSRLMH